jgi:hypothetical protein
MRDLQRFEKQLQRVREAVQPRHKIPGFNQLSEEQANVVVLLARLTRTIHGRQAILLPTWKNDDRARKAIFRKAHRFVSEQAGKPDSDFIQYLLKHHRRHIDHDAHARNQGRAGHGG